MTAGRYLPYLNLIGCLAITSIIGWQWNHEIQVQSALDKARAQIIAGEAAHETDRQRAAALERDVEQLKQAVESAAVARQKSEEATAALVAEREAQLANLTHATGARDQQLAAWEKSLAERDAKIRELDAALTATRLRLEEAVAKLRQSAAE